MPWVTAIRAKPKNLLQSCCAMPGRSLRFPGLWQCAQIFCPGRTIPAKLGRAASASRTRSGLCRPFSDSLGRDPQAAIPLYEELQRRPSSSTDLFFLLLSLRLSLSLSSAEVMSSSGFCPSSPGLVSGYHFVWKLESSKSRSSF